MAEASCGRALDTLKGRKSDGACTHTHTVQICQLTNGIYLLNLHLFLLDSVHVCRLLSILNITPRGKDLFLSLQDASGYHTNNHPWQMKKFLKCIK